MIHPHISRLEHLCHTIPPLLHAVPDAVFSYKPPHGGWSKKEILGHLIDSATNNHHRFVRAQFESVPAITYDPDQWNAHGYYQNMELHQLIQFWTSYNLQLVSMLKLMPSTKLMKLCNNGGAENKTLAWLIEDYVIHLEHHLEQILYK